MANELKKLIREAFNTAYNNHKSKTLSESVDSLKSKMSSSDINKAERAFAEIKNNPEIAYKYAWSPQTLNGGNPKDPQAPFNLLMEMISENMDPQTKKRVLMAIYSDKNPALVNAIKARLMGMKGSHVTPEEATMAIETAWNEMFLGEKSKAGDVLKKSFEDALAEYKPLESSNFGAYIMRRLVNSSSNALRDYYASEKPTSLDAPSPVTGKATEFGSGEDFGSDTLNPMMDPGADLAGLGAGLEGSEDIDGGTPEDYVSVAGDEEIGDEENVSPEQTIGADIESGSEESSAAKRNARQMIKRLEKSLYQAIEEYRNYYEPTPNQEKGFTSLEEILSGLSPKEATAKLGFNVTAAIQDLKKNKTFVGMVDDYLLRNGFVNARGKVESFLNMFPQWIADAVKFKKTGEVPKEFPEDRRITMYSPEETETEDAGLNMKQMHKLVIDTKKIAKTLKLAGNQSKGLTAVESLLTGVDPETVSKNLGYDSVENLAQDIASLNITASPQDIADSAKSLKYGKPVKAVPAYVDEMNENRTFWFLEAVILEEFMDKNLDKIMENVYKRLLPKLNN